MGKLADLMQGESELSHRAAAGVAKVIAMPLEVQQQAAYLAVVGLTSVVQLPGWVPSDTTVVSSDTTVVLSDTTVVLSDTTAL
jgi:hypothetical protein